MEKVTRKTKCSQADCDKPAAYRYTWPGKDEKGTCEEHGLQLLALANAIGMHLQLIPLEEEKQ